MALSSSIYSLDELDLVVCGDAAVFALKGEGVVSLLEGDKVEGGRNLSRLGGNDEDGAIAR